MSKHATSLGKIISHLQSLEVALRAVIDAADPPSRQSRTPFDLKVGDCVPASAFSDFASLGKMIDRYNSLDEVTQPLDRDRIIELRDSLAHGRVLARDRAEPLRLIKFGREIDGKVPVTTVVDMDVAWFSEQVRFTGEALRLVASHFE